MATITTDTFLDTATGTRTAGEAWTMNGCTLTIRTDTRWYSGAPAGMTGSLGASNTSASLGGGFVVDGTKVRWMPFNDGAGNVPAINTVITQGGVSGTLLGVWADLTSAPTAVGAAMPASGWIKFREVTGGTFAVGALSGIGANATGPDVVGWIEVVFRQSATLTVAALGRGAEFNGEWFELGTTNGSAGQTFQTPTNGGGANSQITAIQVETSAGSNVYEWWPVIPTANFTSANIGTTAIAKVAQNVSNGLIRIGSDGTTNVGFTPPTGCRVRIPNIIMRVVTSGTDATNNTVASIILPCSGSGALTVRKTNCVFTSLPSRILKFYDSSFSAQTTLSGSVEALTDNCIYGGIRADTQALIISECRNGFSATNTVVAVATANNAGAFAITSCNNFNVDNLKVITTVFRTSTATSAVQVNLCLDGQLSNLNLIGARLRILSSVNINVNNLDYSDRLSGTVNSSQALQNLINIESSANVIVDGITFGFNGQFSDLNTNGVIVQTSSNTGPVYVRNAGTAQSPLQTSLSFPISGIVSSNAATEEKFQRLYFQRSANSTAPVAATNTIKNVLFENIYTTYAGSPGNYTLARRVLLRGVRSSLLNGGTGVIGGIFADVLTGDTTGHLQFMANIPTSDNSGFVTTIVTENPGTGYDNAGSYWMKTANDTLILETPYLVRGYTGFANTAIVFGSTTNTSFTMSYQLDTGSGWSAWRDLTLANLLTESISPSGFKMKLRFVLNSNSTTARFERIQIALTTSAAAQQANLYPLDTVPITITNLIPGSEVRAYVGTDPATAVEIAGVESSGTSFSFNHSNTGQVGFIRIFALGYQPYTYDPYTYPANATELLVQQVVDRNYVNPA